MICAADLSLKFVRSALAMKLVYAPRASAILYDLLLSENNGRPFLLPANICPIVPITFFKAGVPFEFVDISRESLNMDLDHTRASLHGQSGGYGGVLYVHTYGDPSTPQDFFREIKNQFPDLLLIDDRCLCIPDLESDSSTNADVVLYSTGYAKIADLGFGGYAFLQERLNYKHRSLPFYDSDLETIEQAYKKSMKTRQPYVYVDAHWLQTDFELPSWQEYSTRVYKATESSLTHRQSINVVYNSLIPRELCLPDEYQLWRFNLRVPEKNKILNAIFNENLFASSHYASLANLMSDDSCPIAQELADHVINLFNDEHYTVEMAEQTSRIIMRSI